jgi:prepilin signal peptidase PulO-like enzyme (type II secretory pathway)
MSILFTIIIGLIFGSFLNAVIHRLHSGQSMLNDRSRCVHCNTILVSKDLIPVFSFIFLGGKCRYCQKSISWTYPAVELLTTLMLLLFVFIKIAASLILIVIAVYDFKHYLILDKIVLPAFILVVVYNLFIGELLSGLFGSLIISGFFLLQYVISSGRWIGFGDVKLGLFLGSLVGWKLSIILLMIGYFLGAIIGIGLIISGRKKLGSQVPFGTFLSISAIIVMLYGDRVLSWYLGLLNL